ncbi:MAG: glycosyltransferase family 4 protein [Candidatus Moraniibacteriota bacterium]|nr:MAG: glycosyltransferase family 4 protein [Candidatus Moranbacteria bacterium]
MRIGIDARFYGKLGKGLGRYTQQLIHYLELEDRENEYFIFLRSQNFSEYIPKNDRFHKILADIPWYGFREQFLMPKILRRYKLDLVHFLHFNVPIFYRRTFVVTIHDLILLRHSTHQKNSTLFFFFYIFKFYAYKYILRTSLKRASHILTVSEFSKKDIISHYPFLPKEKITVAYQPFFSLIKRDLKNSSDYSDILKKCGILKPYLLYVGNAYPHKNLSNLIEAFLSIKRDDICLVLVGKIDIFYKRLQEFFSEAMEEKIIIFVGEVSDDILDVLYREAKAFTFVSLYEGCGLPPLEAMARGIPVISSRISAMPEIQGRASLYCDVKDQNSLGRAMRMVLDNEDVRNRCIRRGYEQVKKYKWRSFIHIIHRVYTQTSKE